MERESVQYNPVVWREGELRSLLHSMIIETCEHKTNIFVDAIDECEGEGMRQLAFFFRGLTETAHAAGVELRVCFSSRQYPTVTISACPEIFVQDHNGPDIRHYVRQRFDAASVDSDLRWDDL